MDVLTDMPLLSTKLKIPVPRRDYVVRRALFDRLSCCQDMGVIFVSGGAGTGKTTLLSSFIRDKGLKNVGWLSLDSSNANVYSFWYYFAAASCAFLEDYDGFLSLLRSNFDASHMERLLTMLVNRLCGEEEYYIVLDDVHCIRDEALMRTLEFFIDAMPDNLHLFMLSREDPPIYLGSLAVSGRLLYIDGRQMELSCEEGVAFLKQTLKMDLKEEDLKRLNAYAEGWIGGLQLAAAAEKAGANSGVLLQAGGGIAAEYLTREIYESLSQSERDFLLRTGYLSYFDAAICMQLFDDFSQADFDGMIEKLIQKNLFILCVDDQKAIYRYHNILSEYLTRQFSRLTEERKAELLDRSVRAFEQRGDYDEALRQLCTAGDYKNVMRVARKMGGSIEAWSYLAKVPVDLVIEDADITAQCFMYSFGDLNIERCTELYGKFQERYAGSDILKVMQFAKNYLLVGKGGLPEYQTLTCRQIDNFPFGPTAKAAIFIENANALAEEMQYEEAEICIDKAIQTCAGANIFVDTYALGQKAQLYEEVGRLNESLLCYEKAMEMLKSPSMVSGIGTSFYIGLTGVYMRRMELDKASEALEYAQNIFSGQHAHIEVLDMEVSYHLAEMKLLQGKIEAGMAYVDGILSEYPSVSLITLARLIQEMDCEGVLEPEPAAKFVKELEASDGYRLQPFMRLIRARLLFKKGETEEARKETEEVLAFSRAHKNHLRLIEADLLKIYMLSHFPKLPEHQRQARNLLREAIYYAYENRILLPFYLERQTLLPLLCELKDSEKSGLSTAESSFLRDILAVCGKTSAAAKGQDVLSARELDVLGELARGITNREIAEKLCISQATVKTHVLNIYGKFGVSTRLLAVEEGRKRGLIKPV